jgi:hypothetical protein
VKPSYSDAQVAQGMNLATIALLLLCGTFFNSIGCPWEAEQTLMLLIDYNAELKGRLRSGQ